MPESMFSSYLFIAASHHRRCMPCDVQELAKYFLNIESLYYCELLLIGYCKSQRFFTLAEGCEEKPQPQQLATNLSDNFRGYAAMGELYTSRVGRPHFRAP